MAKKTTKAKVKKHINQQTHTLEEVFDDSLLPPTTEIEKLSKLDPNIMQWLKERAEKEQEFRHKAFNSRLGLVDKTEKETRRINYLGLVFSFILLAGGMFLSYVLIKEDHEILGSIFTGVTLITIGSLFLSKVKNSRESD